MNQAASRGPLFFQQIVNSEGKSMTNRVFKVCQIIGAVATCFLSLGFSDRAQAQSPATQQRLSTERNQSSQRYEINQTFDRQAFFKDNNVWVYNKEFADLFGMPEKYIEGAQGIAAAAFRIEDTSFQQCGFGGRADACRKVEECLLDLYFDESKTPLPWATDIKSQWQPAYASMRWLRPLDPKERPHGTLAVEPAPGIIRNETLHGQMIPFADPVSKREAIFTSNTWVTGDDEAISGSMATIGYTRNFYRTLSVVNLQFGCSSFVRKKVNIRLDAKRSGAFEAPIARFNRIVLPEGFVQQIKDLQKAQSDKNAIFYRSLFAPPLGTQGTSNNPPAATNQ
ncbi:MAG: hypothetical protein Q7K57_00350 [Burkholderiaceae bacterium]|nr:hypothetical protein [Burkholderiaceae bacterium]